MLSAPEADMAPAALTPEDAAMPIHLHPLAMLSISDHVTRMAYLRAHTVGRTDHPGWSGGRGDAEREDVALAPVIGIVLGQLEGRTRARGGVGATASAAGTTAARAVGITMGFEVVYHGVGGGEEGIPWSSPAGIDSATETTTTPSSVASAAPARTPLQAARQWFAEHIDWESVRRKREQLREVFPEYEVVGWYTVGHCLGDLASAAAVHARVCEVFGTGANARTAAAGAETTGTGAESDGSADTSGEAIRATRHRALALMMETKQTGTIATALPTYVYEAELLASTEVAKTDSRQSLTVPLPPSPCGLPTAVAFTSLRYDLASEEIEHIATDAALNIDLQQRVHGHREFVEAAPASTPAWPLPPFVDDSLTAEARRAGAGLRPSVARVRRSLWLLRQHVRLSVACLDRVLASATTHVHAVDQCGWAHTGGTEAEARVFSEMHTATLRNLSLAASQLPTLLPRLSTAAQTLTTTRAARAELHGALAGALLAMQAQAAVALHRVTRTQQEGWRRAVRDAASLPVRGSDTAGV